MRQRPRRERVTDSPRLQVQADQLPRHALAHQRLTEIGAPERSKLAPAAPVNPEAFDTAFASYFHGIELEALQIPPGHEDHGHDEPAVALQKIRESGREELTKAFNNCKA